MEMHPHHHQPNYRPHAINECSLVPRLTSTMERATAVIVDGNEVDECKMEASSSDKTPVGTGRRRQPKRKVKIEHIKTLATEQPTKRSNLVYSTKTPATENSVY